MATSSTVQGCADLSMPLADRDSTWSAIANWEGYSPGMGQRVGGADGVG